MLRLANVSKAFGRVPAISGISLDVHRSEIVGIIGRSGAGKSTLIRCLNGLEKPDTGTIAIEGRDIVPLGERDLRKVRSRIGMIFQHFNLLSSKTVADNIALPLKIAGWPAARRRARVDELLALVGLESKALAYPAQLSGGQKQRVGIARALAADPILLLSDEATSALDPETTASILALLRDINRKLGLTIVMITHEMSVIQAIADRVVVLDQGRIVEEGTTAAVFAAPQSDLTRRLLAPAGAFPPAPTSAAAGPARRYTLTLPAALASRPILTELTAATGVAPVIVHAARGPSPGNDMTIVFTLAGASGAQSEESRRFLVNAGAAVEVTDV